MVDATYWDTLNATVKKQIIRIANGEARSAGSISFDGIPDITTAAAKLARRIQNARYRNHRKRVEMALLLRSGAVSVEDVRCCRHKQCSKLFLIPKSRPQKESCSVKCGRNFRQSKFKKTARRRDLERVKIAMKSVPADARDWKARVARKARVTPNFISYAIRFGQLKKS
jgi:hypothetical protein